MESRYFELVLENPNLTSSHFRAFELGAENKMEKWYFEQILNLNDDQALAFKAGLENKMEKFEQIPNLTGDQAWVFVAGAENKMESRYFELVLENPNLTSSHFRAFKAGLEKKMEKWYFEQIPNLANNQVLTLIYFVEGGIRDRDFLKNAMEMVSTLFQHNYIFNSGEFFDYYNEILSIPNEWIAEFGKVPQEEYGEIKMSVAFLLKQRNIGIDRTSVTDAIKEILLNQDKYGNVSLYRGRNIVFVANNELVQHSEEPRFLKSKIRENLKLNSSSYKDHTPDKDYDEIYKREFISQILTSISNTNVPITVFLSGHGSPEKVYFTDGSISAGGRFKENDKTIKYHI